MPIRGASYVKEERGAPTKAKVQSSVPKKKKKLKKREQSKRDPRITKFLYFLFSFFNFLFFIFQFLLYFSNIFFFFFFFSNFNKNKLIPMGTYCAPKPTAATNGRIGFGG